MTVIMQTMRAISELAPPELPQVELPGQPDVAAVAPLANISGADPSKVLKTATVLAEDKKAIADIVEQGRDLIGQAGNDIVAIGMNLLQKAIPLAAALLVPNPAIQAAARATLEGLAGSFLAQALERIQRLVGDLSGLAAPLWKIAQRAVTSSVEGGEGALAELEASADKSGAGQPGDTHAVAGERSQLIEAPAPSAPAAEHSSGGGSAAGAAAVDAAMSQLGRPYVWGGTGNGGYDCSGLTQWAWAQAGVDIPRTADAQAVGRQITADELQKGDLVVWDGHVAMYAGDGQIIEAGSPVQTNPLRTTNMGMAFKGFWRPTG